MRDSKIFRNRVIFLYDILGSVIIFFCSLLFVMGSKEATLNAVKFSGIAIAVTFSVCGSYLCNGMYRVLWPYAGSKDYIRLSASSLLAILISLLVTVLLRYVYDETYISHIRSALKICGLSSLVTCGYAVFIRMFAQQELTA